jgi:hypothetical protein
MTKKIHQEDISEILKLQKSIPDIISQVEKIQSSIGDCMVFSGLSDNDDSDLVRKHYFRTFSLAYDICCSLNELNGDIDYMVAIAEKDE